MEEQLTYVRLGTHLTLDLMGRIKFGPDVEWVGTISLQRNSDMSRSRMYLTTVSEAIIWTNITMP